MFALSNPPKGQPYRAGYRLGAMRSGSNWLSIVYDNKGTENQLPFPSPNSKAAIQQAMLHVDDGGPNASAMMGEESEHRVTVGDKPYTVYVHRASKAVWIAVGDYKGERIVTEDGSMNTALKRWREAVEYRNGL
jgi:hypothetical protein